MQRTISALVTVPAVFSTAVPVMVSALLTAAPAQPQVVLSSSPFLPILDSTCSNNFDGSGGIIDTIHADSPFTIGDLEVRVEITHTWRSDLQFHLATASQTPRLRLEPQGVEVADPELVADLFRLPIASSTVVLARDHDGSADNYYATFDDEAPESCATACGTDGPCDAPPGPACAPDESLALFLHRPIAGDWHLAVCDDAGGDTGELVHWELTFTHDLPIPVELMLFDVTDDPLPRSGDSLGAWGPRAGLKIRHRRRRPFRG